MFVLLCLSQPYWKQVLHPLRHFLFWNKTVITLTLWLWNTLSFWHCARCLLSASFSLGSPRTEGEEVFSSLLSLHSQTYTISAHVPKPFVHLLVLFIILKSMGNYGNVSINVIGSSSCYCHIPVLYHIRGFVVLYTWTSKHCMRIRQLDLTVVLVGKQIVLSVL